MRDICGLAQVLANKLAGNNQLSEVFLFRNSGFLLSDWRYPFLRNSGTLAQEYSFMHKAKGDMKKRGVLF